MLIFHFAQYCFGNNILIECSDEVFQSLFKRASGNPQKLNILLKIVPAMPFRNIRSNGAGSIENLGCE